MDSAAGSRSSSVQAWALSGVLGAQAGMIVQVGGVVPVVAAQDTMTAKSADGMFILVLRMGNPAKR